MKRWLLFISAVALPMLLVYCVSKALMLTYVVRRAYHWFPICIESLAIGGQ